MAIRNDSSARADEKEDQELYSKANMLLSGLFGTKERLGVFQQEPLPTGFASRVQFAQSFMSSKNNEGFFVALPQPHANALATVMAARGNPCYPPELVVALTSHFASARRRRADEDDDYDDTESRIGRLKLLAEIAALTRNSVGHSRVALRLPFGGRLDFKGNVIGIFGALTPEEREQLGLNSLEENQFQSFSNDPSEAIAELTKRTLSPMQRFYLRAQQWAEQREAERIEREKRRGQHGRGDDVASALPAATPTPEPEPTPEPPTPATAAGPAVLDLAALIGEESVQPPTLPRAPILPATAVAPAPTTAMSPDVLAAVLDEGSTKAKAMSYLFRTGKKSRAEAETLAKAEGLID